MKESRKKRKSFSPSSFFRSIHTEIWQKLLEGLSFQLILSPSFQLLSPTSTIKMCFDEVLNFLFSKNERDDVCSF